MNKIELVINELNNDGVFAISLVDRPAIKSNFVFFSENKAILFKETSDKKTLIGAILIPNLEILRQNEVTKEIYKVFLSAETVKKASKLYLKNGFSNNVTRNHNEIVKGVFLTETWVKESDVDKSVEHGLDLQIGSWVGMFDVENEQIKTELLEGKYKGFSIEGLFSEKKINKLNLDMDYKNKLKKLLGLKIELAEMVTKDGKALQSESFEVGSAVTLDGAQAPPGEYTLENGNVIVLDENGIIIEVREVTIEPTVEMQLREASELLLSENETLQAKVLELEAIIALAKEIVQNPEKKSNGEPVTNFQKFRVFNQKFKK